MKMATVSVVAGTHQRFSDTCCVHHQGYNGGSKDLLWNVGKLVAILRQNLKNQEYDL